MQAITHSDRFTDRFNPARVAGLLYLTIILCGVTGEFVLRGTLLVPGAPAETAARIAMSPDRFRLGIAADTVMLAADIALALVFLALLRPLGPGLASAATAFRLAQAAVIGASVVLLLGVVPMIDSGHDDIALHLIAMHAAGYDLGLIFFGINSILMAVLLSRSPNVPRLLPMLIAGAALVYVTGGFLRLLAPGLIPAFEPAYILPLIAESALCLWLLVKARI